MTGANVHSPADVKKVDACIARLKKRREQGRSPDLFITPELVSKQTDVHWAIVAAIMYSKQSDDATTSAVVQQLAARKTRAVYKDPRKRTKGTRTLRVTGEPVQVIRKIMEDNSTPPEFIEKTVQRFTELEKDVQKSNGVRNYQWRDQKHRLQTYRLPNWAGRLLMEAMVDIRPVPELDIRALDIHAPEFITNVFTVYSVPQLMFLNFAVQFATWHAEPRLTALEYRATGREYGRQLYRGNRLGQGGQTSRMFSDGERLDIINRTCLVCFCPEIARSVPVTDDGCGYIQCRNVQVSRKDDARHVFTEYRRNSIKEVERVCSEITYKDIDTAQEYKVYTRSLDRADLMYSFKNGIYGVSKYPVVYNCPDPVSGPFGSLEDIAKLPWTNEQDEEPPYTPAHIIELDADSVAPVRGYVFSRMLKYFGLNIYRFLFRRTDYLNTLISEHRRTRQARSNHKSPELYTFLRRMGYDENGCPADRGPEFLPLLDNCIPVAWVDLCTVELTLSKYLPFCSDHRERRVEMFRRLWEERVYLSTGVKRECKMTRTQYVNFRTVVFKRIREILEKDTALITCTPEADVYGIPARKSWTPVYGPTKMDIRSAKDAITLVLGKCPAMIQMDVVNDLNVWTVPTKKLEPVQLYTEKRVPSEWVNVGGKMRQIWTIVQEPSGQMFTEVDGVLMHTDEVKDGMGI